MCRWRQLRARGNRPGFAPAHASLEPAASRAGVIVCAAWGAAPVLEDTPAGLYRVEREFLETHTLIPLLYLPRAYAVGGRVRDLRLSPDGVPLAGRSFA